MGIHWNYGGLRCALQNKTYYIGVILDQETKNLFFYGHHWETLANLPEYGQRFYTLAELYPLIEKYAEP